VAANDESLPVDDEAVDKPRPARHRWTLAAAIVVIVVLVVAFLPQFSTLQPAYYERYEGMHVRMENWRASTHARIGCISCHVEPGLKGFVTYGLESIPDFYSQLFFGARTSNLLHQPSIRACQRCHTSFRQVSPAGDLLIPHKAHVQVLKVNCVVCHKNLVHSANTLGFNKPEMSTCLDLCHDGKKATNKCVKCHTRKQTPPSHSQPNWLLIHSQKTTTINCAKCHAWTPDFCAECHSKRPASHTGNWKKQHQYRAKVLGKGCLVCHGGEKFCKKCHD